MRILTYLMGGLVLSLAAICSNDENELCECAVQYFVEDPESPGTFTMEKEVREETLCAGAEGDTLYLSPSSKKFTYDCR